MLKKHASSPWQQSNSCNQVYKMNIVYTFTCLSVSNRNTVCIYSAEALSYDMTGIYLFSTWKDNIKLKRKQ